jgi:hypothetical protein
MSDTNERPWRELFFAEHPSKNGPFPVAPVWLRLFGLVAPYLIVFGVMTFIPRIFGIPLVIFISIIRPLISSKLGGSLFESFVQVKVVDKTSFSKPVLKKFYLREVYIFATVLVSLALGGLFTLFVSLFDTVSTADGSAALYSLGSWFVMLLPFVFVLFNPEEQTLFDKLSGLVVIHTSPYFNINYPVKVVFPSADTYSTVSIKLPSKKSN